MSDLRTKLFLSYSSADQSWCNLFRLHLRTLVKSEDLWIDRGSITPGQPFETEIAKGIGRARCALILVTPSYLDQSSYARYELDCLVAEQARGLTLLPVLVEDCAWETVPALASLHFVGWQGDRVLAAAETGPRAVLRPLKHGGHLTERAVVEICEQVKTSLGIVAQATQGQIDELVAGIRKSLGDDVELEAVHSGDFSVVYRARRGDDVFAVKAVPDAPRQNRIRAIVDAEMPKAMALRDRAFIRMREVHRQHEPHCLVMDYVEGPTLDVRLAARPDRRLDAPTVARLLLQLAQAQREAHQLGLRVGPIKPSSLHVDADWQVRLSPLRVEGVLARAGYMAGGQLMNWDALTNMAPEISEGLELQPQDFDALEQYYLGLLGLELLLGRPACRVHCFDDLLGKARFFDAPRRHFSAAGEPDWTDHAPALAFVLARMLARDPAKRLSDAAVEALSAVAAERLPVCLRDLLNRDLDEVMKPAFAVGFYDRLFEARPTLAGADVFRKGREGQANMLAQAIPALIDFDPQGSPRGGFKAVAHRHVDMKIQALDIEAFRTAFLAQIDVVYGTGTEHHDAWNATLRLGLAHLAAGLKRAEEALAC